MTKKELEVYVEELLQTIEGLRGDSKVDEGPSEYTQLLEKLLDDCEAKIPAFFYGKGWRAHVQV